MRRYLVAALLSVCAGSALGGPVPPPGGVTIDSSTFVAGSANIGTTGGVYSDTLPPVASTTTAAYRMTKYRAQHVNLRDATGAEIGTQSNPLVTITTVAVTVGNLTINNSSFSVSGSSVIVAQPTASLLNATVVQGTPQNLRVSAYISGSSNTVSAAQSGVWAMNNTSVNVATITVSGTPNVAVTNTPTVTVGSALPVGTNNIGTVTGSTVTVRTASGNNLGVIVNNTVGTTLSASLPAGTNNIGTVSGSSVTLAAGTSVAISGTPNVTVVSAPTTVVAQSNPTSLQSSVSINGSSNTVNSVQSGVWAITAQQASPQSLKASVYINGSSNTVQAVQSGTWSNTVTQATNSNLRASVAIDGSSNTVSQGGAPWSENITQIAGNAISGSSLPVNGTLTVLSSSATTKVTAYQGGTWSDTVTQTTPASLQASVSINGSSNTVNAVQSGIFQVEPGTNTVPVAVRNVPAVSQSGAWSVSPGTGTYPVVATQSGTWTNTVTQGTNANLRSSVMIDGSSNTVVLGAGTAAVGSVTLGNGNISNTLGRVAFSTPTVSAMSGGSISASSTGDNVVVSTVAAQTVRVYRIFFTVSAATTITFRDGGGTSLTGAMTFTAGGSFVLDFQGDPWFITSSGNAFIINQSGSAQISGRVYYTQS